MRRTTAHGKGFTIAGNLMLVFGLVGGLASPAFAVAGRLDTTFGGDGKVTTFVAPGPPEVNAVAVQADGKIVAVGQDSKLKANSPDFAVIRYNLDGSLDSTFGGDGIVTTNFSPETDHAYGVAIQADGKILAAGVAGVGGPNAMLAIARYNTDGSPDTAFGGDGKVTTDITPLDDYAHAVVIAPDGKIVLAGALANCCGNATFAAVRYNTDGTLDPTFGGDGIVTTDITKHVDFGFWAAAQADGKVVAAGIAGLGGPNAKFALVRYNLDGSLDSTFGGDGVVTTDFTPTVDWADSVAVQADGKIVAMGFSGQGGPNTKFALARYNPDGTLDATFGAGGKVTTDFTRFFDWGWAVAIQADGKIVAAGCSGFTGGGTHGKFALARYNTDGTLDTTFGDDGKVTTDFTRFDDCAGAVAIGADGKIVVAGDSGIGGQNGKVAVARYTPS
jgi:uncharacterized delta-60 repeat protein